MGWKRYTKKKTWKKIVRKTPQYKIVKGVKSFFNPDMGDFDSRGEAAGQLVKKDVNKQAGAGQIKYATEEYE